MKKILYITSTLQKAGPTNQLSYIIKYLDKSRYEAIVLTLSPEPKNSLYKYYVNKLGINVIQLNLSRIKGIFLAKKKVLEVIKKYNIDLIHTQGFRADVLSSKLQITIPSIATVRNYSQLDFPMTYGRFRGNIMSMLHSKALKKINICCGVSDAVSNNLKNEFILTNVSTVRNGVDTKKYYPIDNDSRNKLRIELGLPSDKKIWINSIGKDLRKNSTVIAKAFKEFNVKYPDNFMIFIGDGELRKECENILVENRNILFTGKVSNVLDYLHISDYFLSSSQAEGLPNAVLEAMACGLPQVLSDIEPHKEIIDLDNNCGRIFKLGDYKDFIFKMEEIIGNEYSSMSKASLEVINKYLNSQYMSQQYQNIYTKLLNRKQ